MFQHNKGVPKNLIDDCFGLCTSVRGKIDQLLFRLKTSGISKQSFVCVRTESINNCCENVSPRGRLKERKASISAENKPKSH